MEEREVIDQDTNSGLDSVVRRVKEQFKIIGAKRRDLIIQLGSEIEKTTSDEETICEEIKNYLLEEITEGFTPAKW